MYRNLIIGMGEVGTALYRVLAERDPATFARDVETEAHFTKIDILHICFPYSNHFIDDVESYLEEYDPSLVIVYSSVPIGTCEIIGLEVVHSPVEGVHPELDRSFYYFPRWLGAEDEEALKAATKFWYRLAREVNTMKSSRYTEYLKLRSTSKYGINLVWTDYEKQAADSLGMDFGAVKGYDEGYNRLYRDLGLFQHQRYILDPPNGYIGGHCVVPNAALLDKQFPNPMLKAIKRMRKR